MKDRILNFLESEHISPAEFADKIGVQRSSMSHILNGRNQPSATFIQKMLHVYPLINSRWLLIGDGNMYTDQSKLVTPASTKVENSGLPSGIDLNIKANTVADLFSDQNLSINQKKEFHSDIVENIDSNTLEFQSERNSTPQIDKDSLKEKSSGNQPDHTVISGLASSTEKEIEQILFFFKDKTFHIYKPS